MERAAGLGPGTVRHRVLLAAVVVVAAGAVSAPAAAAATQGPAMATCVGLTPTGVAVPGGTVRCALTTTLGLPASTDVIVNVTGAFAGAMPADAGLSSCSGVVGADYADGCQGNGGGPAGFSPSDIFYVTNGSIPAGGLVGYVDYRVSRRAAIGSGIPLSAGSCPPGALGPGSSAGLGCTPPQDLRNGGVYPGAPIPVTGAGATVVASARRSPARTEPPAGPLGAPTFSHPRLSAISSALPTPSRALGNVTGLVLSAVIAVVAMLFITFPAQIFNRTLEEHEEEIRALLRRRVPRLARRPRGRRAGGVPAFLLVLLLGSLLGGFLDPSFGANASSLALFIGVALALAAGVALNGAVQWAYRGRQSGHGRMQLHAIPAGLVVGAMCVVLSRLTQFTPGYLYGVVCGVAFAGTLTRRQSGRLVALETTATLLLALVAWLLWVPLHAPATRPDAGFGVVLAEDFLGALFVSGLLGSVISLAPLSFLPGWALFQWRRSSWAAIFTFGLFVLVQVLLQPASAHVRSAGAGIATAVALFVVFGGGSLMFRWYFSRRTAARATT